LDCCATGCIELNSILRQLGRSNLLKEIARTNVIVVIGAGSIGQAIARRVSAGKHVLLADLRQENSDAAAKRCRI